MNYTARRAARLTSSAIFAVAVTTAGLTVLGAPAATAGEVPPAPTATATPTPTVNAGTPWG